MNWGLIQELGLEYELMLDYEQKLDQKLQLDCELMHDKDGNFNFTIANPVPQRNYCSGTRKGDTYFRLLMPMPLSWTY